MSVCFAQERHLRQRGGVLWSWYGMVWCGVVWCGMVWYETVWYGMAWHGMAYGYGSGIVLHKSGRSGTTKTEMRQKRKHV